MTRYHIHDIGTGETAIYHDWLQVPAWARWAFEHIRQHRCESVIAGKLVFYELLP